MSDSPDLPYSEDDVKNFGPAIAIDRSAVDGEGFLNPNGSGAAAGYLSSTKPLGASPSEGIECVLFPRIQMVRLRLNIEKYGKNVRRRDIWLHAAKMKFMATKDIIPDV